jgi:hypothetical protein
MTKHECSIERAWRIFLGLMIFSAASFAVLLIYSAFFAALTRQWQVTSVYTLMAGALAAGTTWLCYHRNELVGLG